MDVQSEREAIQKTINSLKQTTGVRPLGWYVRYGPSEHTRELIVEEGGFIYDSMSYNDDLPYYTKVADKKWLVVPYSLEVNDTKFWRGGMISPSDFYESMKNTFDVLYEEGATYPKMMSIGLHCRISGKPSRIKAVEDFLEYALSHSDVWFARRIDIARWWLENGQ